MREIDKKRLEITLENCYEFSEKGGIVTLEQNVLRFGFEPGEEEDFSLGYRVR